MRSNKSVSFLFILSLVLLAISLGANILLFQFSKDYYLQAQNIRLDPLGLNYFAPNQDRKNDLADDIVVVMFGDSRAAQWPAPAIDGFHFINRGIASQTSAQIAQRYDYHIESLQADVLVLQLCINDLKTIPLFPKNKEAIIFNCQNNLDQIIQQAVEQETIVVLSTIMPVGQVQLERQLFWSDEVALAVDAVNLYIKLLASENVIVFDAFAILADENGALHKEFSRDELHLNSQGYAALNQEFEELLRSLPDS